MRARIFNYYLAMDLMFFLERKRKSLLRSHRLANCITAKNHEMCTIRNISLKICLQMVVCDMVYIVFVC